MARRATEQEEPEVPARNEVVLVGRVAAPAVERELPSGDWLASFRVVVDRPAAAPRADGARAVTVDALDCTGWSAGVRRTARTLAPGDVVEVSGALRRRFWRSGAGAASRTEVEVLGLRRLARAPRLPEAASRRRGRPEATPVLEGDDGGPQAGEAEQLDAHVVPAPPRRARRAVAAQAS